MELLDRLLAGLHQLLRRRGDADLELQLELEHYLRTATEQKIAAGMSLEEAERSARLEIGGFEQVKEHARAIRSASAPTPPSSRSCPASSFARSGIPSPIS